MRNARCDFVSLSCSQWYPIWLGYAGAWLEHAGHDVLLIDAPTMHATHEMVEQRATEFRPDMLVVYTGQKSRANDIEVADRLTEGLNCISVLVGPYFSSSPVETLQQSRAVEYGVDGEFEFALAELAGGKSPGEIGNLVYRDGDRMVKNEVRPYLTTGDLDRIPFVTRFFNEHLDIRSYKTISERYPYVDLMTGRGCAWGQCTFCLWVHTFVKGRRYNLRSIENVIEEFTYVVREMPAVRSVMVQDDTLTEERAEELSRHKLARRIRIPWSCYSRGDLGYETMKLMKRANCRNLHVGYESADPQILKAIRKGVTLKKMEEFTRDAKRAGLHIHADFAVGFPGESPETVERTIRWAKRLNPDTAQFQLANALEGTPFHQVGKSNGWIDEEGGPDYPDFRNSEIRAAAKRAYRAFYLSPRWAIRCLRHPYEKFFSRMRTMSVALPAMLWRRW